MIDQDTILRDAIAIINSGVMGNFENPLHEPYVVSTIEELDALPKDSVILSAESTRWYELGALQKRSSGYWYAYGYSGMDSTRACDYAPFTVLHIGGEK